MDHSFIYTTEKVENCPKQLYCGFEIIDGMLKTINIMPGRNEYLMGEDKLNPEFDLTKLTADCFSASVEIKDEKNTVLTVTIEDPTRSLSLRVLIFRFLMMVLMFILRL